MREESWVCVDGHGDERIFSSKPYRGFPNYDIEILNKLLKILNSFK